MCDVSPQRIKHLKSLYPEVQGCLDFEALVGDSQVEAIAIATSIWTRINLLTLHENILPTRQRADLILKKGESHQIEEVALRRL